jgi:hypothetical protein
MLFNAELNSHTHFTSCTTAYPGTFMYTSMIDAFFESEISGCNLIKTRSTTVQWFRTSGFSFTFVVHCFMRAVIHVRCVYVPHSQFNRSSLNSGYRRHLCCGGPFLW